MKDVYTSGIALGVFTEILRKEYAGFPNGVGQSLDGTIANINSREWKLSQLRMIESEGKPVGELSYNIRV